MAKGRCAPSRSFATQKSGLSTSKMTSRQTGHKMSGAHGTNSGDKSKGLHSSGGSGRVGQECKTFSSGIKSPGGPREL